MRTRKPGRRLLSAALALALLLVLFAAAPGSTAHGDSDGEAKEWRDIVDVIVGYGYTIALRADGRVLFAGDADSEAGQRIAQWEHIVRIQQRDWPNQPDYIIGYREDGGIRLASLDDWDCWAEEDFAAWTDVKQMIAEDRFCLGLTNKGTVLTLCRDSEYEDAMKEVSAWTGVQQLATDGDVMIAGLRADGNVLMAALSEYGREWKQEWEEACTSGNVREIMYYPNGVDGDILLFRNDGTVFPFSEYYGWTDIKEVFLGTESLFGLRGDGTVEVDSWRKDDPVLEEVSTWTDIVALDFHDILWRYVPVGLCRDGTVRGVTKDYDGKPYGYWDFTGWSDVVKLYSGNFYTVGIRSDHTVLVTGGENGFLFFDEVADWTDIQALYIPTGDFKDHVVGLKTDGTLVAAGDDSHGQCQVSR